MLLSYLLELVTQCILIWYSVGESNPSLLPWKGSVLADRRTEHIDAKFLKNSWIDFSIHGWIITQLEDLSTRLLLKYNTFGIGDRNRTCIKRICNPPPNLSGHTYTIGIPLRNRTATNSFGDYCATTTPARNKLAEAVRFELTVLFNTLGFKASALDHSTTLPNKKP